MLKFSSQVKLEDVGQYQLYFR